MNKKIVVLATIFAIIIVLSYGITLLSNNNKNTSSNTEDFSILTSFYPMYILTKNITDGADNVSVKNLTPSGTGCLHEYQFTTSDMKNMETSDVFIINGGGMEGFIEDVAVEYPDLAIIDSSKNVHFISNDSLSFTTCDHDHEHEDDDHEHSHNSHIWMDTENYISQIKTVRDELCKTNPKNKDIYNSNADKYINKIQSLNNELKEINFDKDSQVIIFHDSFAYLANKLDIPVCALVEVDNENTSLSSGEIAHIIDEAKEHNAKYIFVEEQFSDGIANTISKETGAKIYVIDSLVSGNDDLNSYINGMKKNIETLKKINHE